MGPRSVVLFAPAPPYTLRHQEIGTTYPSATFSPLVRNDARGPACLRALAGDGRAASSTIKHRIYSIFRAGRCMLFKASPQNTSPTIAPWRPADVNRPVRPWFVPAEGVAARARTVTGELTSTARRLRFSAGSWGHFPELTSGFSSHSATSSPASRSGKSP